MLLETLDVKKNDIIIYSQNIFNLENNFKIIFKDDKQKLSREISYSDVCRFVNEFTPKNLIVYRLLTNIKDFKIDLSKYGFTLYINDQSELIYFDPAFAVKELEKFKIMMDFDELRFRIQQVGLSTLNRKKGLPNFTEIYAVDLEAMEAKFINDKAFADAILAFQFDKNGVPTTKKVRPEPVSKANNAKRSEAEKDVTSFAEKIKQAPKEISSAQKDSIEEIKHEISEDKDFDYTQIIKMNFKGKSAKEEIEIPGDNSKKNITGRFGEFLKKKRSDDTENKAAEGKGDFIDIFKSSTPLHKYISSKQDKKIVLKLDKK